MRPRHSARSSTSRFWLSTALPRCAPRRSLRRSAPASAPATPDPGFRPEFPAQDTPLQVPPEIERLRRTKTAPCPPESGPTLQFSTACAQQPRFIIRALTKSAIGTRARPWTRDLIIRREEPRAGHPEPRREERMPTDVIMPQMGESIFEGTITKWLKNIGDAVEKDEPLFEISTDKVDAEIPSPVAGVLTEIRFPKAPRSRSTPWLPSSAKPVRKWQLPRQRQSPLHRRCRQRPGLPHAMPAPQAPANIAQSPSKSRRTAGARPHPLLAARPPHRQRARHRPQPHCRHRHRRPHRQRRRSPRRELSDVAGNPAASPSLPSAGGAAGA